MLGFGGWRGFLGAVLGFWGLAALLILNLVYLPWLHPVFLLVPAVVVPVVIMWRRENERESECESAPRDRHPA